MVTRTYTAPQFNVRDERSTPSGQVAQADTRSAAPVVFGDESWRDRLVQQFAGQSSNVLEKMADIEFSNAYLEGQAAAGVVASEEELQGDSLTRDWRVAGYRDTLGKLALAEAEAKFSVDIKGLREQGPEELQAYLSKRRAELTPMLASMSSTARASSVGQLLLQDRAATTLWASESANFITEKQADAVHSQWYTTQRALTEAQILERMGKLKPGVFTDKLRSSAGVIAGVWVDGHFQKDAKQQLTFDMVKSTLLNGSVEMYDYLARNALPDVDGTSSTLLSRLDPKQQQQLATEYESAMKRTDDARNWGQEKAVKNIEAQIKAGVYAGTYESLNDFVEPLIMSGAMSKERGGALISAFLDSKYKSEGSSELVGCYLRGDRDCLRNLGKTEAEGAAAVDAAFKDNTTPAERFTMDLQSGRAGMDTGLKNAGATLSSALRQVRRPDGSSIPSSKAVFDEAMAAYKEARLAGNNNFLVHMLSGMSPQDQMYARRIFKFHMDGATLDDAVGTAADLETKEANMSPSARAGAAGETMRQVQAAVKEIEPLNWLEAKGTQLAGVFNANATADYVTRVKSEFSVRGGFLSDHPVVRMAAQTLRNEVLDAANVALLSNPLGADPESAIDVAKANVMARTYQTGTVPLILPEGADASRIFGVPVGKLDKVGTAISNMLKPTKSDSLWHVQYKHRQVFVQEYDRDGKTINDGYYLNPKDVGVAVDELIKQEQLTKDHRYGRGKTVSKGGINLKYNGASQNYAASPTWMLEFRDNLVGSEGITDVVKEDLSGRKDEKGRPIMTTGVGVSSHNPRYPKVGPDGKVSPEEIRKSFLEASNDAAIAGRTVAKSIGMDSKPTFLLLSEIAYQSGPAFNTAVVKGTKQLTNTARTYQEFLGALKAGDTAAATAAFKRTAAWYYSIDPQKRSAGNDELTARRKHYLALIEQATTRR